MKMKMKMNMKMKMKMKINMILIINKIYTISKFKKEKIKQNIENRNIFFKESYINFYH
jgi:hypothetical protein